MEKNREIKLAKKIRELLKPKLIFFIKIHMTTESVNLFYLSVTRSTAKSLEH